MNAAEAYRARVLARLNALPPLPTSAPSQVPDRVEPVSTAQLAAGIGQIANPEGYKARVRAALNNANPRMSTAEDMGRSGVTGLEQGGTGFAGMLTGGQAVVRQALDAGASLGAHIIGDPTGGADVKNDFSAGQQAAFNAVAPAGPIALSAAGFGPTQQNYDQTVQSVAGPYHQPQTWEGRLAQTLGQNAPAALMPGSAIDRIARVAMPSAGGQAAYELAPDPYKGYAKVAGGLLGGGVEGWRESLFKPPYQTVGQAMPDVTDQQIGLAQALKQKASAMGINLSNAEAMDRVTGGRTDLGRLMRLAESSRVASPRTAAFFADRPGQVDSAVRDFTGGLSPEMPPPGMLGQQAQQGAQGAQTWASGIRKALSSPGYRAADPQTVDPGAMGSIIGGLDSQIASDKTGLLSARLAPFRASLVDGDGNPINDIGNLSTARNYWRDRIDLPPTGSDPLTKYESGVIGGHLDAIDDLLKANPNRQFGDALYSFASRKLVDPMNAGPVGTIAASPDLATQTAALYPKAPYTGAPDETSAAVSALDAQQEGLAGALTRQHMEHQWNQSSRSLQNGLNQFAGAKYAKDIAGNSEQAATLGAGLNAIDPSGALGGNWDDLVEALRATGTRQPIGSKTTFNASDMADIMRPGPVVRAIVSAPDILEWGQNLKSWAGRLTGNQRMKGLADILLDPDLQSVLSQAKDANALTPYLPVPAVVPAAIQSQGRAQ